MERQWNLIKAILAHAECMGNGDWMHPPAINGYTPDQVMYHVSLCGQAEFLEVKSIAAFGNPTRLLMKSLTWKSHTELERLRGSAD